MKLTDIQLSVYYYETYTIFNVQKKTQYICIHSREVTMSFPRNFILLVRFCVRDEIIYTPTDFDRFSSFALRSFLAALFRAIFSTPRDSHIFIRVFK